MTETVQVIEAPQFRVQYGIHSGNQIEKNDRCSLNLKKHRGVTQRSRQLDHIFTLRQLIEKIIEIVYT